MSRLDFTKEVEALLIDLEQKYGELILYQGGGCCDGSAPLCMKKANYRLRKGDVMIGKIGNTAYWVDKDMFALWKHLHFTLSLNEGRGSNEFSLECSVNKNFVVNLRLLSETETSLLDEVVVYT